MYGYKDSLEMISECEYQQCVSLMDEKLYEEAVAAFENMDGYRESAQMILECKYLLAAQKVGAYY